MNTKSKTGLRNKEVSSKKIINAAAHLFSRKGYSAIGIREISKKAGVNISMISYYYGGKSGLIKAIINEYFSYVDVIAMNVSSLNLPPRESLKKYISELVKFICEKKDLCRVAIIEMPIEMPEITQLKVELLHKNMKLMSNNLAKSFKIYDAKQHVIIGPAFLSLIFSGFIFENLIKKFSKDNIDKDFTKRYCDTISDLFLDGMTGIAKKQKSLTNKSKL